MVKVRPFKAALASQDHADKLISPPYDVLNTEEARAMAEGNDCSFLHVNKPEIDLPPTTDPYADEVYQKGRDNLVEFQKKGYLVRDDTERLYIYRQVMGDMSQTGIVACTSIDDYETSLIKRHEHTIKKKEEDRTKLTNVQGANVGPVFLTYHDDDCISKKMMEIAET